MNTSLPQQYGFSTWKILPWLVVAILAGMLVWVAQNPNQHGNELQGYLPKQLQVAPKAQETPSDNKAENPKAQDPTWYPVIDQNPKTNPDTPTPVSSYRQAVSRASQSVVNIYTTQKIQNPYNDPTLQQFFEYYGRGQEHSQDSSSLGSGVIVSKDGYIVTNAHVIEKADEIIVAFNDGQKQKAKIVGSDTDSDLAVIKVEMNNLTPLAFRGEPIEVGDVVLAIGNPFGVGQTVTQGIISATGRAGLGVSSFEDFIQTDAAINPGNSGGALVDANGALIGINTMIYSRSGGSVGIGFAIPTSIVEQVMNGLIQHGKVSRGWLGVEIAPVNTNPTDLTRQAGVTIARVIAGGPADKAGLLMGDVILSVNNTPVQDPNTLIGVVARTAPNGSIPMVIKRNGQEQTLSITVGERPTQGTDSGQRRELTPEERALLEQLLRQQGQR